MGGKRVLVGVTGSIAAYKAVELVRQLTKAGFEVQVALTGAAQKFIGPLTFGPLTHGPVLTSLFDLHGGEISHVEGAHEVDAVVVAPATANAMARFAAGMADDVVAATVLATRAPVLIAPAMESGMWLNQATQENVTRLKARGFRFVGPDEGELASGRSGIGRLVEVERIAAAVEGLLSPGDLAGVRVVVTGGPTHERIDPVRLLSNRSTGSMGIALARAAASRGASVTLLLGPTHLAAPAGVDTRRIESAQEMLAAGEAVIDDADVLIAAAAVSDFRPATARPAKLKRSDANSSTLALVETPDVLATLAARRRQASRAVVIVGFAAETEDVQANARAKLERKGCDLVIGNRVGPDTGFGERSTSVIAVGRGGSSEEFGPASKTEVADFVLDQVVRVRKEPS